MDYVEFKLLYDALNLILVSNEASSTLSWLAKKTNLRTKPGLDNYMETTTIAVAGATGDLGYRITKALIARSAKVRAIVRKNTSKEKVQHLQKVGVEVVEVDLNDVLQVAKAVSGASCVVSALAGLKDVIVDTQLAILQGAIKADVPRLSHLISRLTLPSCRQDRIATLICDVNFINI